MCVCLCLCVCVCIIAMLAGAMLTAVLRFSMPLSHRDPRASPLPSVGAVQCPPELEHTHDVRVCARMRACV